MQMMEGTVDNVREVEVHGEVLSQLMLCISAFGARLIEGKAEL
jgi:hypothetical protein